MIDLNHVPFVQARWFTPTTGRTINKIVLHSMEAPEKGTTAEATAHYFATLDRQASAHYCVDSDSIVQCVQCRDVAYGAPGANHDGVHVELAGYARQTAAEWQDVYSTAMLHLAAELCGRLLAPKFQVPALFLTAAMMEANPTARGFTTHWEVTKAFKRSTHTDPGANFPVAFFMSLVRGEMLG